MMANLTQDPNPSKSLPQLFCSPELTRGVHSELITLVAVNVFLSITAILGNTLIQVALHKESSLHPPTKLLFRCLATTDLGTGIITGPFAIINWISLVCGSWDVCLWTLHSGFIAGYILSSVSLLIVTAISVDRLLALMLGLRYRQVVTLKRTRALVLVFWVMSTVGTTMSFWDYQITLWCSYIGLPLCLVISMLSYSKIVLTLRSHQNQVHHHVFQEQPSREISFDVTRYRKAASNALLLQLALVACHLPFGVADALMTQSNLSPSIFIVREFTFTLVFLNSSLNPILYCWKVREVRQEVTDTLRLDTFCC